MQLRKSLQALLFLLFAITANAQTLPNVQLNSLRAPAGIKIDGKPTEWNNKFQAYNQAAEVFYTIANDDKNLYLTVQATDQDVINRIAAGAVIFTIKINNNKPVAITYPVKDHYNSLGFIIKDKNGVVPPIVPDSIVARNNDKLTRVCKWIGVNGIDGLDERADSLLVIDNNYGIKSAQQFDNKSAYTFEIAIPLKYLHIPTNNISKLAYNIRLNGISKGIKIIVPENPNSTPEELAKKEKMRQQANVNLARMQATIDFGGEYTLTKGN